MKRGIFCILCATSILFSATACGNKIPNENVEKIQTTNYEISTGYVLKEFATPLWSDGVMENETVMFSEFDDTVFLPKNTENKEHPQLLDFDVDIVRAKSLLYPAEEIYAVYSYDRQTEYVEGKDWVLIDGKIALCPGSSIPVMTEEIFYPTQDQNEASESIVKDHPYIFESTTITQWQVVVTYKHSESWNGPLPKAQSEKVQNFIKKLENGEEVTILFYGDSITTGADTSGTMGVTPLAPSFAQIITEFIAEKYGYSVSKEVDPYNLYLTQEPLSGEKVIHYINTAVSGTTSTWGISNVDERVIAYDPDLVVLAFGMNEGGRYTDKFTESISKLIGLIQTACPETETVLVSTMLPHFRFKGYYRERQSMHGEALTNLVQNSTEIDTSKIAMANVTEVHEHLLKYKEYYDMTGNNVNHPNDFLARVYTSAILGTMFGDYME